MRVFGRITIPRTRWSAPPALLLACACLIFTTASGQSWDVDKDTAPPTTQTKPLRPQKNPKPYHLEVYRPCKDGKRDGKVQLDIVPESGLPVIEASARNDTVFMRVKFAGRFQNPTVILPRDSFHLVMFLGQDTAVLKIKYSASELTVQYLRTSELLILDTECVVADPVSFSSIQLFTRDAGNAHELLNKAKQVFPQAQPITLSDGYYPCLPLSAIGRRSIGRHRVVNQTARGYLVCFRVPPETKPAFDKWAMECTRDMAHTN